MGAFVMTLLFIRPQFVFLVPFLAVYLVWLFWRRDDRIKNWIGAGALVGMMLCSFYAQATYNYIFNMKFSQIPFTGLQLLTVVVYVSDPSDAQLFDNPRDVEYLRSVYQRMERKGLSYRDRADDQMYFDHFNRAYAKLCLLTIVTQYMTMIGRAELNANDWETMDRFMVRLSTKLLRKNFTRWIVLTVEQIKETSGHLCVIMIMLCTFSPLQYWKTREPIRCFYSVWELSV